MRRVPKGRVATYGLVARVAGLRVVTLAGLPPAVREALVRAFVSRGAVQCGFCTPGMITRAAVLLAGNHSPTRDEVARTLRRHLCRCTGYIRIVDAVLEAARLLREGSPPEARPAGRGVGVAARKRGAEERAAGRFRFEPGPPGPGSGVPFSAALDPVLFEGLQQADEASGG